MLIVLFLGLCVACKKKMDEPVQPDLSYVKEIGIAEADLNTIFGDLDNVIDSGSIVSFGRYFRKDTSLNGYTKYLELMYTGIAEKNISRSGSVKCFMDGSRRKGTYRDSVILENTKVNDRLIQGYFLTKQTDVAAASWTFDFKAGLTSQNQSGGNVKIDLVSKKTRTGILTTGVADSLKRDDNWFSSGSLIGRDTKGQVISVKTLSPLQIKASCSYRFQIDGVQDFYNVNLDKRYRISYGNGGCDHILTYIDERGTESIIILD